MHIASANGYSKVVEFLLENHANVDAIDRDGWTPTHAAACWGHVCILNGSYLNTNCNRANANFEFILIALNWWIFPKWFQMEILDMLAMSGADLNAKNRNDETPSGQFDFSMNFFLFLFNNFGNIQRIVFDICRHLRGCGDSWTHWAIEIRTRK